MDHEFDHTVLEQAVLNVLKYYQKPGRQLTKGRDLSPVLLGRPFERDQDDILLAEAVRQRLIEQLGLLRQSYGLEPDDERTPLTAEERLRRDLTARNSQLEVLSLVRAYYLDGLLKEDLMEILNLQGRRVEEKLKAGRQEVVKLIAVADGHLEVERIEVQTGSRAEAIQGEEWLERVEKASTSADEEREAFGQEPTHMKQVDQVSARGGRRGYCLISSVILLIVLVGVVIAPFFKQESPGGYLGRVVDETTRQPVQGAKVILDFQDTPYTAYTDSEGVYRFPIVVADADVPGRIRVNTGTHEPYDRIISLSSNSSQLEDIRLTPHVASQAAAAASSSSPTHSPANERSSGQVLYDADWSNGRDNWLGLTSWSVQDGMLVHDGSSQGMQIIAPYEPGQIADYAVEAEIQVVGQIPEGKSFGLIARSREVAVQGGKSYAGYFGVINPDVFRISRDRSLETAPVRQRPSWFNDWHSYRLEVQGTSIRLLVDGNPMVETSDTTYSTGGRLGLWSNATKLNVRAFRVVQPSKP